MQQLYTINSPLGRSLRSFEKPRESPCYTQQIRLVRQKEVNKRRQPPPRRSSPSTRVLQMVTQHCVFLDFHSRH